MQNNLMFMFVLPRTHEQPNGAHVASMPTRSDIELILQGNAVLIPDMTCLRDSDNFPGEGNTHVAAFGLAQDTPNLELNKGVTFLMDGSRAMDGKREVDILEELGAQRQFDDMVPVYGPVLMYYSDDEQLIQQIKDTFARADA